nr:hypothetical protein Q903MT_gene3684 [Picea sitchensis]
MGEASALSSILGQLTNIYHVGASRLSPFSRSDLPPLWSISIALPRVTSRGMELDVVSSMGVTLSFFHGPPLPCPSTSKARLPCCFYCFATT